MGMMESNSDANGACGALDAMWHYASMMAYVPHMHAWWLLLSSFLPIDIPIKGLTEFVEQRIAEYRLKAAEFIDDAVLRDDNNFLAKMLLLEKQGKVTPKDTQQAIGLN